MPDHLLTVLAPMLTHRPQRRFNVFDVMHHGTHEKQLSNVFAWLLKADATHGLGSAFQRIFVEEVNRQLGEKGREPIPDQAFGVRQEQNTAPVGEPADIADIVLDGDDTTIVIENYGVPDGHEHSYQGYLGYGARQTPPEECCRAALRERTRGRSRQGMGERPRRSLRDAAGPVLRAHPTASEVPQRLRRAVLLHREHASALHEQDGAHYGS